MIKIVQSTSFDFGMPALSLMNVHSGGVDRDWMCKRASSELISVAKNLRPDRDSAYLHLIDMGAQESYGCNRNGDGFNEKRGSFELDDPAPGTPKFYEMGGGLVEYHHTFTKHAHVYKHHQNTDPAKRQGDVYAEYYNPIMKRGELIIKVPLKEHGWEAKIQKLASGKDIPFSMACVSDPDYPVLTKLGYKKIKDVRVGDIVLTHTGAWQRVKALNRRKYSGTLHRFHLNGLPLPLEITADHLMWAKAFAGSRKLEAVKAKAGRYFKDPAEFERKPSGWLHANHLNVGDRLFYQPIQRYEGYGAFNNVPLARLMGYYLAEGSLSYNGERACTVEFTCNLDDSCPREIPKLLASIYPKVRAHLRPHQASDVALVVGICNTRLAEFMRKYVGAGCRNKTICPEIFNGPDAVKLAFLGAWLEGDGFVDKKGVHWSSANLNLVLQGRDLLATMGIPSSIYKIDHSKCETSGYSGSGIEWTLNLSHLDASQLEAYSEKASMSVLYREDLQRKKPASMRPCPDGRYAYRIKQVETREVVDCQTYNIEVEEDESYVLAGLVSHNCKVAYDVCTSCGNKAPTRAQYCNHLRDNMTAITKSGHQIFTINDRPQFFDISEVVRPADRIAYSLYKAAHASIIGGAELAEQLGVMLPNRMILPDSKQGSAKVAAARKLADIEKQIEGVVRGEDNQGIKGLLSSCPCGSIPPDEMETMQGADLKSVISVLSDAKICLPLRDFLQLVMGSKFDSVSGGIPAVEEMLPGIFNRMIDDGSVEECASDSAYDPEPTAIPQSIKAAVGKLVSSYSLASGPTQRRMISSVVSGNVRLFPEPSTSKFASAVSASAAHVAREYAKYQLSFASANQGDNLINGLVIKNYVKS